MTKSFDKNVILLVDNKVRDLDGDALIAHHLRNLGIECHLEPLEAFRAVLAAYRPHMIIFNIMTASHLVEFSKRLAEVGVLTAVLPNEGILYDYEILRFLAGRHHSGAHIDYFFCWNDVHRRAIKAEGFDHSTVEVVGVPRFDFYFEPWSRVVRQKQPSQSGRPKILLCTNFIGARYWRLPKSEADKWFSLWAREIPLFRNYWQSVEAHWEGRNRFFDYVKALLATGQFDITLRPHPLEEAEVYKKWIDELAPQERERIQFNSGGNIFGLILDHDLEVSCETCTTALEGWIAKKPTIELLFKKDPLWFNEMHSRSNIPCDDPAKFPDLVNQQLQNPAQPEKAEIRRAHLETWCATPDGQSSLRVAKVIANAVNNMKAPDWSRLSLTDYRRAAKLLAKRKLNLAYHFDPLLSIKGALFPKRYAIKKYVYEKSIRPSDVEPAIRKFESVDH
jgi:surface carbohydrate biosynthesis protein